MFLDRADGGRQLAAKLQHLRGEDLVVQAPRKRGASSRVVSTLRA